MNAPPPSARTMRRLAPAGAPPPVAPARGSAARRKERRCRGCSARRRSRSPRRHRRTGRQSARARRLPIEVLPAPISPTSTMLRPSRQGLGPRLGVGGVRRRRCGRHPGRTLNQLRRHRYKAARLERGNRQLATRSNRGRRPSAPKPQFLEVTALLRLLLVALFVAVAGATVFSCTWDIPAPTKQVETVVPDERLPR